MRTWSGATEIVAGDGGRVVSGDGSPERRIVNFTVRPAAWRICAEQWESIGMTAAGGRAPAAALDAGAEQSPRIAR
jgi:hypothetical protein